jgi:anti-sigma factor RsiW
MNRPTPDERTRQLIAEFIDGEPSETVAAELNQHLMSFPQHTGQVVDQLLLDSLLMEELGSESLTALVDLVANESDSGVKSRTAGVTTGMLRLPRGPRRLWQSLGGVAVVTAVVLAFVIGRWESTALASAATVVRAAIETHAEHVERVYIVQTDRSATGQAGFSPPRDVRVATQGSRFYVEMNRGERQWFWGLNADGAIWLTLGPHRAIVVDQDECGVPLQYISDLYTLELETLLNNFLKHCRLKRS